MPVDLAAALGHLTFLALERFRLEGEAGADVLHLARALGEVGLAEFELRVVGLERVAHLADAALPLDELLAERRHGEAVFVAGHLQREVLLADALLLGLHVPPRRFEFAAGLAGVAVDLAELFAELFAGALRRLLRRLGAQLEFG